MFDTGKDDFLDAVVDHVIALKREQGSSKWHKANQEQQMEANQEAEQQMGADQEVERHEEEEKVSK